MTEKCSSPKVDIKHGCNLRHGKRCGFTLVELLVVIAIITILIAILLPTLSRASASAESVQCEGNLHSMGQILLAYCANYEGHLPYGLAEYGTGNNQYDSLLFSFYEGVTPETYMATRGNNNMWRQAYAAIFHCPSAVLSMSNPWSLNYACNPNFFYQHLYLTSDPRVALNSTLAVSAIRDPANSLAIGDANQAFPDGGSWVTFDWQQEGCAAPYAGVGDYLVPPDGFIVGGMANSDWSPTFTFGTGLRYRHNTWSRAGGWGNAVFFDGHATGIPINRNTSGTPANAPGSQGGAGLRIKNIYDPVRAPTVIGS